MNQRIILPDYNNELISVVIPSFNRSELLVEMIDSLIAQTYTNWECLVIDDGSTDNTFDLVKDYSEKDNRIKYYKRTDSYSPGGCGARNYGLDISNGEYIVWFDNDDVMLPGYLKDLTDAFRVSDNFVITSHLVADENLNSKKEYIIGIQYNLYKDYVLWKDNFRIITANVLFRKSFITEHNYRFNEEILRGQETELFSRIFYNSNNEFNLVQKHGFLYRQHQVSKTHQFYHTYNPVFVHNQASIHLYNLKNGIKLKDDDIKNKNLMTLSRLLFRSKRNSKSNYFYIVNGIRDCFKSDFNWCLKALILKIYYFLPKSSRINYRIRKKLIVKDE